jgi:Tat protein secretion system quality control protein TatD with DNase activity
MTVRRTSASIGRRSFLKAAAGSTAVAAAAAWAGPARRLEFWDSHGHLNSQFPAEWVDALAERMHAENVTKASLTGVGMLSDHEDTDVLRGYEKYPQLFFPFLCNFDPNNSKSIDYVRHQLRNGPWRGVGEIYLDTGTTVNAFIRLRDNTSTKHPYPVPKDKSNNAVFRQVFELCGEKGIPAFIHCEDPRFLCEVAGQHPGTKFLAAHCDYQCRPEDVRQMLQRHPNVWSDVGAVLRQGRHKDPKDAGAVALYEAWRKLLTEFPERICLGSDTYSWLALEARFYHRVHEVFHELTAHLSDQQAQAVAKGNFQRMMQPGPPPNRAAPR